MCTEGGATNTEYFEWGTDSKDSFKKMQKQAEAPVKVDFQTQRRKKGGHHFSHQRAGERLGPKTEKPFIRACCTCYPIKALSFGWKWEKLSCSGCRPFRLLWACFFYPFCVQHHAFLQLKEAISNCIYCGLKKVSVVDIKRVWTAGQLLLIK